MTSMKTAPAAPDQDAEFLETLQEPMEALALGEQPNSGRFCGFCYARLPKDRGRSRAGAGCEICKRTAVDSPPVASVPAAVLAVYMAKRRREGIFVNGFAFTGIFLAMVVSLALWLVLPPGWLDVLPFAVLVVLAYYLARLLGLSLGAELGHASGVRLRERRWRQYLATRAASLAGVEDRSIPSSDPSRSDSSGSDSND